MGAGEAKGPEAFERACARAAEAFDEACQGALGTAPEGLYVSPLWEAQTSDPGNARAWKRSVLRRVPGAGAEPWGHLFLLVLREGKGVGKLSTTLEGLLPMTGPTAGATGEPLILTEGPPRVVLLLRPRAAGSESGLRSFAVSVQARIAPPGPPGPG